MSSPKLLPCPFCGGPAAFEYVTARQTDSTVWSVGCANEKVDCIGFQMLMTFARKIEAADAWNTRMGVLIDTSPQIFEPWTMSFTMNDTLHISIFASDEPGKLSIGAHYGLLYAPHTVTKIDKIELEKGLAILSSLGA